MNGLEVLLCVVLAVGMLTITVALVIANDKHKECRYQELTHEQKGEELYKALSKNSSANLIQIRLVELDEVLDLNTVSEDYRKVLLHDDKDL